MADSPPTLPRLGGYTLLAQIATGGMAEVYLATQDGPQGFRKIVVIKRILPHLAKEPDFVRMFLDEARLAALINHPNVVSIYELGEEPVTGAFFMAMEYIDGRNLRDVATHARKQKRPLPPRLCARIIADACAGLHFAHELSHPESGEALRLVHRDISPENLLVTYGGLVKIVDFGIAKAAQSESLTKTGQVKGKLSYLSPEQLQGRKVDRRADLWSLGITLQWLLTGEKPFKGESEAQVMRAVLEAAPPPLPKRGRESLAPYQRILDRALAKEPSARYSTALELQEDLEQIVAQGEKPTTAAVVAASMEKLFPKGTDPERLRHRQILKNEPVEEISLSFSEPPLPRPRRKRHWGLALVTLAALVGTALLAREVLWKGPSEPEAQAPQAAPAARTAPDAATAAAIPPPQPEMAPASDGGPTTAAADSPPSAQPVAAPAPAEPPRPEHEPKPTAPVAHLPSSRPHELAPGFLSVQTKPGLAIVVDGVRSGVTPVSRLRIAPGRHRVELVDSRNPAHTRHLIVVEVRSGQTVAVR